ncbi:hypothetical protein THAOC_18338, partial [Thalassiosira oceanica]
FWDKILLHREKVLENSISRPEASAEASASAARGYPSFWDKKRGPPQIQELSGYSEIELPPSKMTEHDAEEFRLAFEELPHYDSFDQIRTNDPGMTSIHIDGEDLSDNAARLLGRYIATNDHMREISMRDVSDSLFERLRGSRSLTELIFDSMLSYQTAQSMVQFLMNAPKLNKLEFRRGSSYLRVIIRTLNGRRSIEKLSLDYCDPGSVSTIGSCILPNLKSLRLANSGMTSPPPLHGFPKLYALSLFGNKINKEGFARLNEYLASDSCQLQHLNLADTGMTDEDIQLLARALKSNRSVSHLNLYGNYCGEAGYRSILKTVLDMSSIKATLGSNTCLHEIVLPKENDYRYESESDSDASEYNTRDGFEEIRNCIHLLTAFNSRGPSPKERVVQTHLKTQKRKILSANQGIDYSFGSLFAEIPTCVLPELFAILWQDPDEMDPFRALVATVNDWTSLVDRRLMVQSALERNRALIKQLAERNLELEAKLKGIELSSSNSVLSGSKRTHGQVM